MTRFAAWCGAASLLGCADGSRTVATAERATATAARVATAEPVATATAAASPRVATPATPSRERIACAVDDDCIASCRHGAVARTWHIAAYPGTEACEDGCTAKGTDAPRCESGACVAYRLGARDAACTGVTAEAIVGVGLAHRCVTDEQCALSCAFGAVNREWLRWQPAAECAGDCTDPGHDPPRCESGRCEAYRDGKRQPSCTARAVPR